MAEKTKSRKQWLKENRTWKRRLKFAKLVRQWEAFKVWTRSLWCKVSHRADYVCWDDFWRDIGEHPLPGPRSLLCQRCMRAWHEPNPRDGKSCRASETAFEYDSDKKLWTIYSDKEYVTRFFAKRERKEKCKKS